MSASHSGNAWGSESEALYPLDTPEYQSDGTWDVFGIWDEVRYTGETYVPSTWLVMPCTVPEPSTLSLTVVETTSTAT